MTTRRSANASAGRRSEGAAKRVCAVVIAYAPCLAPHASVKSIVAAPNRRTPLTRRGRSLTLGSSMSRTPNAAKPIFAFVARISMR